MTIYLPAQTIRTIIYACWGAHDVQSWRSSNEWQVDDDNRFICFTAKSLIKSGEEILHDYGNEHGIAATGACWRH